MARDGGGAQGCRGSTERGGGFSELGTPDWGIATLVRGLGPSKKPAGRQARDGRATRHYNGEGKLRDRIDWINMRNRGGRIDKGNCEDRSLGFWFGVETLQLGGLPHGFALQATPLRAGVTRLVRHRPIRLRRTMTTFVINPRGRRAPTLRFLERFRAAVE